MPLGIGENQHPIHRSLLLRRGKIPCSLIRSSSWAFASACMYIEHSETGMQPREFLHCHVLGAELFHGDDDDDDDAKMTPR
eukprot:4273884-Karenia_brevis.AAC.1